MAWALGTVEVTPKHTVTAESQLTESRGNPTGQRAPIFQLRRFALYNTVFKESQAMSVVREMVTSGQLARADGHPRQLRGSGSLTSSHCRRPSNSRPQRAYPNAPASTASSASSTSAGPRRCRTSIGRARRGRSSLPTQPVVDDGAVPYLRGPCQDDFEVMVGHRGTGLVWFGDINHACS